MIVRRQTGREAEVHGLVNQAIRDLAVNLGGESMWADIKAGAGVDVEAFVGMQAYPDDVTYRLVASASEILGIPESDVLQAFGRHWILYTAKEGYGPLFEMMGRTLPDFLRHVQESRKAYEATKSM